MNNTILRFHNRENINPYMKVTGFLCLSVLKDLLPLTQFLYETKIENGGRDGVKFNSHIFNVPLESPRGVAASRK